MYGERIGAFTFLCGDEETAAKVLSQVKIMIRTMYSNAPLYGARVVTEILNNSELRQQWLVKGFFPCIVIQNRSDMTIDVSEQQQSKLKWIVEKWLAYIELWALYNTDNNKLSD